MSPFVTDFFADIASKRLAAIRLLVLHFKEAERLLRTYALSARLRTLDSLQLAVAVDLRSRGMVSHFVCADRELLPIAAREGLFVLDPESPTA